MSEQTSDCCVQEESDEYCEECLRLAKDGGGHIPNKAKKGFKFCSDCYNQLNTAP